VIPRDRKEKYARCGKLNRSGSLEYKGITGEPCAVKAASTGSGRGGRKRSERNLAYRLLHCILCEALRLIGLIDQAVDDIGSGDDVNLAADAG
jgi:hypothetical protein